MNTAEFNASLVPSFVPRSSDRPSFISDIKTSRWSGDAMKRWKFRFDRRKSVKVFFFSNNTPANPSHKWLNNSEESGTKLFQSLERWKTGVTPFKSKNRWWLYTCWYKVISQNNRHIHSIYVRSEKMISISQYLRVKLEWMQIWGKDENKSTSVKKETRQRR